MIQFNKKKNKWVKVTLAIVVLLLVLAMIVPFIIEAITTVQ